VQDSELSARNIGCKDTNEYVAYFTQQYTLSSPETLNDHRQNINANANDEKQKSVF
jgi:hypothetical protein